MCANKHAEPPLTAKARPGRGDGLRLIWRPDQGQASGMYDGAGRRLSNHLATWLLAGRSLNTRHFRITRDRRRREHLHRA